MRTARKSLFSVVVVLLMLLVVASAALAKTPTKVMIVVMDQMRPEYAQQYDMTNVQWLQNHGVNFPHAYVGDMASETVVSHNVMVSGLFPKHMGWSDEAFRDVDNVMGFGAGAIVTSGDLGFSQYVSLIQAAGNYPKLGDYLRARFPGTIVANVGQKGYQVESMAAESSDLYVRMGSKKPANPALTGLPGSYRGPSGILPFYISSNPRYFVSVGNDGTPGVPLPADYYGTKADRPAWLYPEDGRYVPGPFTDPANYHESGDAWVADAAIDMIDHENWSGMFVTLSAIDKIGHMWGGGSVDNQGNYTWDPESMFNWVHMPFIAKNADNQLGRILDKLREKGQLDDTLIVLTADHGAEAATNGYFGNDAPDGGNLSWYAGTWHPGTLATSTTPGPLPIQSLGPNVDFSYQSTAIETWLKDFSWANKVATATKMGTLPGVIATYVKSADENSYVLQSGRTSTRMTPSEKSWWLQRGQELVDTMASRGSADVVGLLANRVGYGVFGDHGGAQQQVQRIPMVMSNSSIPRSVNGSAARLVDLMPTVLRTMGIPLTAPVDGRAYKLPLVP